MIIGIDGYAGAGKDTVADILTRGEFTKVSFADALREAASQSFKIPLESFLDRQVKDNPFTKPLALKPRDLCEFCDYLGYPEKCEEVVLKFKHTEIESPRHLLQFVGTEVGRRTLNPTIWLDKYVENIQGLKNIVTPDARFDNERELIKSMEGLIMWVRREGVEPESTHISANQKWPLGQYDVIVHNNGTRYDLIDEIGLWWTLVGSKR